MSNSPQCKFWKSLPDDKLFLFWRMKGTVRFDSRLKYSNQSLGENPGAELVKVEERALWEALLSPLTPRSWRKCFCKVMSVCNVEKSDAWWEGKKTLAVVVSLAFVPLFWGSMSFIFFLHVEYERVPYVLGLTYLLPLRGSFLSSSKLTLRLYLVFPFSTTVPWSLTW